MRRLLMTLLAAATLAGCDRPDGDAGAAATPAAAPVATPAGNGALPRGHYVFGFSTPPEVMEDPRIVEWAESPCGDMAYAVVETMPMSDPVLKPDFVAEFDAAGRLLRHWAKPFSAEIVAVSGERLHFRARHEGIERVFWTQADGRFGLLGGLLDDPKKLRPVFGADATPVECPDLPLFTGSGHLQCQQVTDESGAGRLLAWEGACS